MTTPPSDNTPWRDRILLAALTGLVSAATSTAAHAVVQAILQR